MTMSTLTAKDLHWFRLANSAPTAGFYEFKDRFLRRFAERDGYDLQEIELVCHGCDGSGKYAPGQDCNRCGGSGIYDTREHWLERWNLRGSIYHRPVTHAEVYHANDFRYPEPVQHIEGRIQHPGVSNQAGRRAYYRLLVRHEPVNFYRVMMERMKWGCRMKWHWCAVRIRDKMDLFRSVPDEDIPF